MFTVKKVCCKYVLSEKGLYHYCEEKSGGILQQISASRIQEICSLKRYFISINRIHSSMEFLFIILFKN